MKVQRPPILRVAIVKVQPNGEARIAPLCFERAHPQRKVQWLIPMLLPWKRILSLGSNGRTRTSALPQHSSWTERRHARPVPRKWVGQYPNSRTSHCHLCDRPTINSRQRHRAPASSFKKKAP